MSIRWLVTLSYLFTFFVATAMGAPDYINLYQKDRHNRGHDSTSLVPVLSFQDTDLQDIGNGVMDSFHKQYYENAFIVEKDEGLVRVETVGTRVSIRFKPEPNTLDLYKVGRVTRVTFDCFRNYFEPEECDMNSGYILAIGNHIVEPISIRFAFERNDSIAAVVTAGPGDDIDSLKDLLVLRARNGDTEFVIGLKLVKSGKEERIRKLKKGDVVKLNFYEKYPRRAKVKKTEFEIVKLDFDYKRLK